MRTARALCSYIFDTERSHDQPPTWRYILFAALAKEAMATNLDRYRLLALLPVLSNWCMRAVCKSLRDTTTPRPAIAVHAGGGQPGGYGRRRMGPAQT